MYDNAEAAGEGGEAPEAQTAGATASGDDDAIDAEFEVKDDA